jgi:hypothetical protein
MVGIDKLALACVNGKWLEERRTDGHGGERHCCEAAAELRTPHPQRQLAIPTGKIARTALSRKIGRDSLMI